MTPLDATAPPRIPNNIRNRLISAVSVLVLTLVALTVIGFGMLRADTTSIKAESQRADALVAAEGTLHLGLVRQQAMVIAYALRPTTSKPAGFDEAVDAEVGAFVEIGRLAGDDPALMTAALEARHVATEWR